MLNAALGRERALHYIHSINLAQREWRANRIDEARRILDACPPDLRHWEWHYLYRQCHVELLTIRGHAGFVSALAVSPGGGLIAAASASRDSPAVEWNLTIWDAVSGKTKLELAGQQNLIAGVAFSPDGGLLTYVGIDKTIHICDAQTGRELRKITDVTGITSYSRLAFSPDGTRLAALAGSQILVYDPADGTQLFTLSGHTGTVRALAFSADGRRLVSGGTDRLVKLWNLASRKELFSSRGHLGAVVDVAFSPKEDQVVSCGGGSGGTARGEVRFWNATDGKQTPLTMTFPFSVNMAAFTAEAGQIVCASGEGDLLFLDATTGRTAFTLHGHGSAMRHAAVTRDGTRLVTSAADGTVRVWPVRNPEFVQMPLDRSAVAALAFSPDGTRLVLSDYVFGATPQGNAARMRVIPLPRDAEGSLEILPRNVTFAIHTLAFFPDNRRLAGADRDGVHLWDLNNVAASRFIAEFGVWDVSISPDGRHVATATRNPDVNVRPDATTEFQISKARAGLTPSPRQTVPAIKIWRVADGQLERTLPGQISVSFSPDGRRLAGARDRSVVVWDAATGEELRTLVGPADPVLKVQFTAGGRQIVGFTHRQATVWDSDTGRIITTVDGLNGPAFVTPDGRRIVGIQGGIKWWDVQLGRELLFLPMPEERLWQLALSADGRRVAAASENKLVLWEAGPP